MKSGNYPFGFLQNALIYLMTILNSVGKIFSTATESVEPGFHFFHHHLPKRKVAMNMLSL